MSNIIKFPNDNNPAQMSAVTNDKKAFDVRLKRACNKIIRFIWIVTVLVWPILKWVLSIEVFFQFMRMIYYWNSPNINAVSTFLLHFTILTAITYFISSHKPKRI